MPRKSYGSSRMPKVRGKYKATATTNAGREVFQFGNTPEEAKRNLDKYIRGKSHTKNRIKKRNPIRKVR